MFCIFEYFHGNYFFQTSLASFNLWDETHPGGHLPTLGKLQNDPFISQWLLWNLKGNQFLWKQTEWLSLKSSTIISFLQLHWLHQLSIKSVFFFFFLNFTDYVVKLNRHQLATLCFTKQNHKYFCSSFMKWIK